MKLLDSRHDANLLERLNAFTSALNSYADLAILEDLGDELADALDDARLGMAAKPVPMDPPSSFQRETSSAIDMSSYLFSAFFPDRIEAEETGELRASAFLQSISPKEIVEDAARNISLPSGAMLRASVSEPVTLGKKASLWVTPVIPGLCFDVEGKKLVLWKDSQSVTFRFRAHGSVAGNVVEGFVHFWLGGLIQGSVPIKIYVALDEAPGRFRAELARANARPYRSVFPSYSHRDKLVVDRIANYARAFGDEFLRDVDALRAGENWPERIKDFIRRADVFQLFWSENAAVSEFIQGEWTVALQEAARRKEEAFIRPVYWTSEVTPTPPKELGPTTHFARITLEV